MSNPFVTINPATGETLESHPLMSDAEAAEAVRKCHEAFLEWRLKPVQDRARMIAAIGQSLRDNKAELAALMTREVGKVRAISELEIDLCAGICDWTAQNGPGFLADEARELDNGARGFITYSPLGVIYGIQPWNFPAYQAIRYSVACLMAGNGVLLKHAENVTGSAKLLDRIYKQAGLPDNLFTVLVIDHEQSDKIIAHDLVRGVTLTGSPEAGRIVGEKAGAQLKKTVLELGGNDAYIVLEDADLEQAVTMCVQGRLFNNGETCTAAKRFVVVDALYDAFQDAYVAAMKSVKTGDPEAEETMLGPIAREDLRDNLHKQVEDSVKNGAKILCGGEKPDGKGYFYPATVLGDVKPGQPAYDDELFGPVAALIRAKDQDDAMRIANDSRFGLGGGIFTKDVKKATELAAKHFDTGMVFINGFGTPNVNMPFGGVRDSGYGREHGGFGMREFVNAKSIVVVSE